MAKQNMRLAGRVGCKMRRPTSIEKREMEQQTNWEQIWKLFGEEQCKSAQNLEWTKEEKRRKCQHE
jgi:hypothetical protein